MAPAPAPWAVLGDALWCLGLGCLLAAARDALRLALGEGKLRCFLRDAAFFAAAAVLICGFAAGTSAGGLARWYMSAAVLLLMNGENFSTPENPWRFYISIALFFATIRFDSSFFILLIKSIKITVV